jgi:DNA-binding NarL/FixJ family response regulator
MELCMTAASTASVLIVDDHDIVRFGMQTLVLGRPELRLVGGADRLAAALALIAEHRPDVVLTDMSLPDSSGLDTVRAIVAAQEGRHVLVVSMQSEDLYGEQVLAVGAHGYVPKEQAYAYAVPAIARVLQGGHWLSEHLSAKLLERQLQRRARGEPGEARLTLREVEVLEHLRAARSSKQIAADLGLSTRTVELYRASIKRKLGLRTGTEVLAYAFQRA